jgi:hypothetical protein
LDDRYAGIVRCTGRPVERVVSVSIPDDRGTVVTEPSAYEKEVISLRSRIEDLEQELNRYRKLAGDARKRLGLYGLTGQESRVLIWVTKYGPIAATELTELISPFAQTTKSGNLVVTYICRIRQRLKPYGITIHRHSGGYYLSAEDKEKIERVMAGEDPVMENTYGGA